MVRLGRTMPAPGKKQFLERGQPLVESAFQAHSDDIPVGMELVALWRSQGKTEESLSLARALKLREPEDETVLAELVQSAIAAGRHELAIDEAKKALVCQSQGQRLGHAAFRSPIGCRPVG